MAVVSGWSGEVAKAVKDINQGGSVWGIQAAETDGRELIPAAIGEWQRARETALFCSGITGALTLVR